MADIYLSPQGPLIKRFLQRKSHLHFRVLAPESHSGPFYFPTRFFRELFQGPHVLAIKYPRGVLELAGAISVNRNSGMLT